MCPENEGGVYKQDAQRRAREEIPNDRAWENRCVLIYSYRVGIIFAQRKTNNALICLPTMFHFVSNGDVNHIFLRPNCKQNSF